jgi:hypothetical protein
VIQLLVARQCVEVDLLTGSQTARDQVPGLHARRSDLSEQLTIGRLAGRAPRVLRVDASHENGRSLPGFFHAGHDTVPTRASAKQRRCAYLAPPGNEAGAVFRRSAATGPARRAASDLAAGAAQAEGLGAPAQAGAAFLCGTWSAVALLGSAENHGARLEPVFEAPGVLSEQHATQLGEPVGAVLEHAKDRYALVSQRALSETRGDDYGQPGSCRLGRLGRHLPLHELLRRNPGGSTRHLPPCPKCGQRLVRDRKRAETAFTTRNPDR